MQSAVDDIVKKLNRLPPERVAEVKDFIEFLEQRDDEQLGARAAMQISERSLNRIWDNDDDAEYDQL